MNKVLPAEWALQRYIQLTWPHKNTMWDYMLDEVVECFKEIAKQIVRFEHLIIITPDKEQVKKELGNIDYSSIHFVEIISNDTWARDHGGITVFENEMPVIYDFTFNGWGLKFPANFDNLITRQLFLSGFFGDKTQNRNCMAMVLEGGSIESDGNGTLLTTTSCLLADNRNNKTQVEIENELKEFFNLKQILWLHHGYLAGDDTDGHIDTLARMCPGNTIAYVKCTESQDEHYQELKKMELEIQSFKTIDGKNYHLVPLPMADPVYENGERLPATYANFLILNNAVLVPFYNSPKDQIAKQKLQEIFPDREIVGIDCNALIKQHGSLHCVTMQYY